MKTLVTPALLAGIAAALILTVVQAFLATPLILQAETYEQAASAEPAPHEHEAAQHSHDQAAAAAENHHSEEAWSPEDGWQRTTSTASANLLMGVGYALILVGLYRLRRPTSLLAGLGWGLAGYISVFVAPSIGLHPELPGTVAAELGSRQEWWIGTAFATAGGIALGVFARQWWWKALGVALIALPHIIGAPLPAVPEALAPENLQHQFIAASAAVNAVFWLVLGVVSAALFRRANPDLGASNPA
jgi:cobalt transporter subunit CbtA